MAVEIKNRIHALAGITGDVFGAATQAFRVARGVNNFAVPPLTNPGIGDYTATLDQPALGGAVVGGNEGCIVLSTVRSAAAGGASTQRTTAAVVRVLNWNPAANLALDNVDTDFVVIQVGY